jgi:predicted O-methyltransferase YrrM
MVYSKVNELSLENVLLRLNNMNIDKKYMLIRGDVEDTLPEFIHSNPGFRTSLIYIDVDLDRPTYHALKYLWDRLLPGGVVIFDEYEYHKFSESNGFKKFFRERIMSFDLVST